mgnify:CR=1 FL=1
MSDESEAFDGYEPQEIRHKHSLDALYVELTLDAITDRADQGYVLQSELDDRGIDLLAAPKGLVKKLTGKKDLIWDQPGFTFSALPAEPAGTPTYQGNLLDDVHERLTHPERPHQGRYAGSLNKRILRGIPRV